MKRLRISFIISEMSATKYKAKWPDQKTVGHTVIILLNSLGGQLSLLVRSYLCRISRFDIEWKPDLPKLCSFDQTFHYFHGKKV